MKSDDESWPAPAEADAFRLALGALVRLHAYEPLAAAVTDGNGTPVTTWWPVAYALQRIADPKASAALKHLLSTPGKYTVAFAANGLGGIKDRTAVDGLLALLGSDRTPPEVVVSTIRALAQIADPRGAIAILKVITPPTVDPNVRLEGVTALGALKAMEALPVVQDLLTDPWPPLRAAALRAAVSIDQENFLLVLASLEPDRDWTVRAALAEVLGTLPAETVSERLHGMLGDEDKRVHPAVLSALVRLQVSDAPTVVLARLKETDFAVRAAAARLVGQLKPAGGPGALKDAYTLAQGDSAYDARAAILAALAEYGAPEALEVVKTALADKDWAVRIRAVELLAKLDPGTDYRHTIRPAPSAPPAPYDDPGLRAPSYSPHVFIDTAKGTIEFELAVLDAPQTSRHFVGLIRKGFFNGVPIHRVVPNFVVQSGDPRGDGEGGPGFTIRDELNEQPFIRGAVGVALSWRDTAGSQFFITHSPQPHLDARYTVFGHVVNGMDVVDRIQQGDVIQRMRVWDGQTMQ
jgi:cyclophilin family peptidyl-prolyl cis-trans isomerase/HEAT repeat protein